jgi:hypothetical protein
MVQLLDGLKDVSLTSLDISMTKSGVSAASKLAELLSEETAFKAVLARLAIGQNKFGSNGGAALVEAIKTSNLESITIGKDLMLPVKGELDSPSLDASNQDINPGDVTILAWWLATPAGAALEAVNLDGNYIDASGFKTVAKSAVNVKHLSVAGNPICYTISTERPTTGDHIVVLASMVVVQVETDDNSNQPFKDNNGSWHNEVDVLKCSGTAGEIWHSACSALARTSLESIGLSKCGLNPDTLAPLTTAISSMAALASVNLSGNRAIDQESRSALQESVSSRQPTIELIWDK